MPLSMVDMKQDGMHYINFMSFFSGPGPNLFAPVFSSVVIVVLLVVVVVVVVVILLIKWRRRVKKKFYELELQSDLQR